MKFLLCDADDGSVVVGNDCGVGEVAVAFGVDFVSDGGDHLVGDVDGCVCVVAAGGEVLEGAGAGPGFVVVAEFLHDEESEHGVGHGEEGSAESGAVVIAVEEVYFEFKVCC